MEVIENMDMEAAPEESPKLRRLLEIGYLLGIWGIVLLGYCGLGGTNTQAVLKLINQ